MGTGGEPKEEAGRFDTYKKTGEKLPLSIEMRSESPAGGRESRKQPGDQIEPEFKDE